MAAIMMPFVIGLDLIKFVRTELNLHTPMIMISALDKEPVILEAVQLAANYFIGKPFKPSELILRIKRIIQTLKT